jgi:hypothetical protein
MSCIIFFDLLHVLVDISAGDALAVECKLLSFRYAPVSPGELTGLILFLRLPVLVGQMVNQKARAAFR